MKIESFNPKQGINGNYRKENHFDGSYMVVDMTNGNVKIDLRLYSTQNTSYACVWFGHNGDMANGSGKAGGWGYHRPSAAAFAAFYSAGVFISDFSGTGQIVEALEMLAAELGLTNFKIFHAHP